MQGLISVFYNNQIFFSIIISFLITIILCKLLLPLFVNLGFLDQPTNRSNHSAPIALGGGVIVIPIIVLVSFLIGYEWPLVGITALLILFLVSLVDDLKSINALIRLAVHFFCVSIYVHFYLINQLSVFTEINKAYFIVLFYLFSIVGISWFINAFNFMDGIDGITSVNIIYLTVSIIFLSKFLGFNSGILHYTIIGVILGFLLFNWSPASIFLGDSGSIPLGFLMTHLLFDLAFKGYWVAAIILPMYYSLDTSITLIIRAWRREKFWQAHSQHFYQKYVRSGKSHKQVCYSVIVLSSGLFFLALLSAISKNNLLFLILSIVWCIFFLLNFSNNKKKS